ncbi:MAG: ZIP family metal transporter [Coriobacteriia bacterium]|nr:ZIP family metal transporter [Coriobacteriia bacterium]
MPEALLFAAIGTGFTFFMTAFGSALVFLFKAEIDSGIQKVLLGFAAGVMIAVSAFGMLVPAIEETERMGGIGWIPAAGGFVLGIFFLIVMDSLLPHLHPVAKQSEGLATAWRKSTLLMLSVTLHNIPEGMAVGLAFALAAQHSNDPALLSSAIALCIGLGIQNFPEGAAISIPLRQEGMPAAKAFVFGSLSAIVEPIFGILVVLAAGALRPAMPWLLAAAAGAMMFVVVEDLIPEARLGEHSNLGTLGVMGGFLIMMVLDVALG